MKRFDFPLEKVLAYKGHVQRLERDALLGLRQQREQIHKELAALQSEQLRCGQTYLNCCEEGTSSADLAAQRRYMDDLQRRAEAFLKELDRVEQQIYQQLERLLSVSKDKTSMEKLREKCLALYQDEQRKENEKLLDEFIANSTTS
jgi:flagellar FliJ protein